MWGSLLFLVGSTIHSVEIYTLCTFFETSPIQDYVVGTYFMGVGIAMVSLSNHPILKIKSISRIGQTTLGIYAIHYIFVDWLGPVDKASDSFFWELAHVPLVLTLSILASFILTKNKITKRIVT